MLFISFGTDVDINKAKLSKKPKKTLTIKK